MPARNPARSPGPIARSLHRFLLNRAAFAGLCMITLVIVAILSYPLWWSFKPNDIDLLAMNAGAVMTRNPVTITPHALATEALQVMNARAITCLFVVNEEKKPVGILHIHDCLRAGIR